MKKMRCHIKNSILTNFNFNIREWERGNDVFYYGGWIREPGVAICSCNDGLRPVIFKLEAMEEKSHIEYEPVNR